MRLQYPHINCPWAHLKSPCANGHMSPWAHALTLVQFCSNHYSIQGHEGIIGPSYKGPRAHGPWTHGAGPRGHLSSFQGPLGPLAHGPGLQGTLDGSLLHWPSASWGSMPWTPRASTLNKSPFRLLLSAFGLARHCHTGSILQQPLLYPRQAS